MTEDEWVGCTSPEAMLNHLGDRASARKLRLYAVNCCWRIWHLLTDDRCRHAVEVAKAFSDGRATPAELASAGQVAAAVARVSGEPESRWARSIYAVGGAAWAATRDRAWVAAWDSAFDARMAARDFVPGTNIWEAERQWQAGVLRDLFGNPFRPSPLDPFWLLTDDGVVPHLARVIYDEDRFGDLPYLADALEDAGCTCEMILDHLRGPGPHYRGCWVVDAVLGFA
jgi:hypothetical protein